MSEQTGFYKYHVFDCPCDGDGCAECAGTLKNKILITATESDLNAAGWVKREIIVPILGDGMKFCKCGFILDEAIYLGETLHSKYCPHCGAEIVKE